MMALMGVARFTRNVMCAASNGKIGKNILHTQLQCAKSASLGSPFAIVTAGQHMESNQKNCGLKGLRIINNCGIQTHDIDSSICYEPRQGKGHAMPFKPIKKILVVEDDQELCNLYQAVLESEGYEVDCVNDGDAALRVLSGYDEFSKPYDLCILDLMIPGTTGDEVSRIIKYERLMLTPVLVISGMAPDQLRKYEANLRQIQAFLPKPFNLDEFIAIVGAMTLNALRSKTNNQLRKGA